MRKFVVHNILIFFICSLLFLPFLGSVHLFDWDEINFAECAREMIVSGNYLHVTINFLPFWEKPPLFIWMQALAMNTFGVNEFAARLPNALCGIITSLVLFNIGKKIKNSTFGIIWVLTYIGSFLPHFYFKSGIIDPWFNFFIFLGIYYMVLHTDSIVAETAIKRRNKYILLSSLFIGMSILTKGPVALLIYFLCIITYWATMRFKKIYSYKQIILSALVINVIGGIWFFLLIMDGNYQVVFNFIKYQLRLFNTEDSGHGGPVYYHVLVLLLGCFPASIFAIAGFKHNPDDPSVSHFKKWMIILFFVVLVLFSIVKTKILHYSSLCYFPLSFLAAYSIEKIISGEMKWKKWMAWLTGTIGLLIGIVISLPPFIDWNKEKIISSNLIKDEFAIENLKAYVHWSGYEMLPGLTFIVGIIIVLFILNKKHLKKGVVGLFVLSLITVNLVSTLIVPKIEKYSQAAAIEFYKKLQNKDCYVETLGFKSYAQYYYSHVTPSSSTNGRDINWLLNGNIDKPAFFACKIIYINEYLNKYPQLEVLYKKNGFVFLRRKL